MSESGGKTRLKVLVFDNNGTLLDDVHLAYGCVRAIFGLLRLPSPSKDRFREEGPNDIAGYCQKHGVPDSVTHEELDVVRRMYYSARMDQARYRPDTAATLGHCASLGLKLAICSAEMDSVLREFLNRGNISHRFAVVRSAARPKAPALADIVSEFGVMPDEAAYLDDTVDGIRAARAAGVRPIAFAHPTAYALAKNLWAEKPDHVVSDFIELRRLMSKLVA